MTNICIKSQKITPSSGILWDYYQNNEDIRTYHSLTNTEMLQERELSRQHMTEGSLAHRIM